jgi:hypothetical protein
MMSGGYGPLIIRVTLRELRTPIIQRNVWRAAPKNRSGNLRRPMPPRRTYKSAAILSAGPGLGNRFPGFMLAK